MSYEIIKSIIIKDGKVIIRASSNNISPRRYDPEEIPGLTRIYQNEGRETLELVVFKEFESGSFQVYPGIENRYTRALSALRAMPEYSQFNWRNDDYEATEARRKSPEFDALLRRALEIKHQTGRFVIHHPVTKNFLRKRGRGRATWIGHRDCATVFSAYVDADQYRKKYSDWASWEIVNSKEL